MHAKNAAEFFIFAGKFNSASARAELTKHFFSASLPRNKWAKL
jgi:hypothetical protein